MTFFSVFNKLRIFDVTLTNIAATNANRLKTLTEKKTLLKQILYETRPHKLEIGLFKPSLNYNYKSPHIKQSIQRINTLQCNNIHNNTIQYRKSSYANPIIQRFDTIQTNVIHNSCDTFQQVYKFNNFNILKEDIAQNEQNEQIETVQQSDHVQQSATVQPTEQCETLQLYNFSQQLLSKKKPECQFYVLMPLSKLYIEQAGTLNIRNISITTALSDTFLQKYTNRALKSTKNLLTTLFTPDDHRFENVKLYVACLSYCPFEGEKKIKQIIADILYYNTLPGITEICLDDTFGYLRSADFEEIIEGLTKNMDMRKLSVRLCMKQSCTLEHIKHHESNIAKIIQVCIQNNVYQFDVISADEANHSAGSACKILNYETLYDNIDDYAELAYYA